MRALGSILGILLSLASFAAAQQATVPDRPRYVFQRVGEDVGLATLTVTALAQDSQGFMWIGTQSGLLRYDGRHARHYGVGDGLASTFIDQVVIGPNNRVIVGTRKGISVCHNNEFMLLPMPKDALAELAYQYVAADGLGNIYLATRKGLLQYKLSDPSKYSMVTIEGASAETLIDAVYAAPDNTIWFATGQRLGMMRPGESARWLDVKSELPNESVLALIKDGDGTLWIRTAKQVAHYDPTTRTVIPEMAEIPYANDSGIPAVDRSGNLLVPTVAGIYRRIGGHWEAVDRTRGMPVNATYSITEDHEGAYWVGLAGAGVVRWQGTTAWEAWTQADGLPDSVIWAVNRDRQGRLWVGTNNGLAVWEPGTRQWRTFHAGDGLNGSLVRSIAMTADGAIWVAGFPGGLTRFDPVTLRPEKVASPTPEPSTIMLGPDGRLWLGTSRYLKVLRTNQKPFVFDDMPVPPEVIGTTAQLRMSNGVVWACGRTGISKFDGHSWRVFTAKDGLKPDYITEIAPVNENEVWFHYEEAFGLGQMVLTNGKPAVRHYTKSDGLPADEVYMLGTDHQGNVWAGGPLGLTKFGRDKSIRRFTRSDGLIWDDLDAGAFLADSDGSIYFGTSGGLARYKPTVAEDVIVTRPRVVITSAVLGNKDFSAEQYTSVSYRNNTLQIGFAALTFRDPDRVRCYYRLNGLESQENETMLREARYPALPPGDYRFEVYCKSALGAVSSPAQFAFTVEPTWWQRWETRLLAMAFVLLSIAAIIKARTSALERERLELERAVAERNADLARANQELKEASLTDPLTGVRNRRFFDLLVPPDVNQAVRAYSPVLPGTPVRNRDLIFYLIDVDHFKRINDEYGHAAGDRILIEISRRISSVMRQSDVLIRWGGEEFLLVSRSAERSEAMQLAGRILHAVAEDPYELPGVAHPVSRTCSVGWAPFPWYVDNPELVSYETSLKFADRALYRAKETGRNRACGVVPCGTGAGLITVSSEDLRFDWAECEGPIVDVNTGLDEAGKSENYSG